MASLEDNPLEYWLAKSTNPLNKDEDKESIQSFCQAVNGNSDGPNAALRLICHKIQSPQEHEALQGLIVLEHCVKLCDYRFHLEIGKFRFLNEMVKVVSPKYLGLQTSERVKKKVIELLYEWMITLKNEPKIGEAYNMLKKQGVVLEDPVYIQQNLPQPELPSTPTPRPKNAVFEDQEKSELLHKLLQSKNPEDLQAANRLIKTMVKEDEKRTERISKRLNELETAASNTKLLSEMLDNCSSPTAEELELMRELYESCEKLRPALFRLASETDEGDEGIAEILKANDEVTAVMSRYKELLSGENKSSHVSSSSKSSIGATSLLELTSPVTESCSSILDDQLLQLGLDDCPQSNSFEPKSNSVIDQLDDIFTGANRNVTNACKSNQISSTKLPSSKDANLLMSAPLEPLNSNVDLAKDMATSIEMPPVSKLKVFEGLDDLVKNSFSQKNNSSVSFPTQPSKTPMNQMMKKSDEHLILVKEEIPTPISLENISVLIQDIKPATTIEPVKLLEKDGINVVIHFAMNKPRDDVNVMVATTLSRSSLVLSEFHFKASVDSSMIVKIGASSATVLSAFNPILPPSAITNILLVSNPSKAIVRLNYKISYRLGNSFISEEGTAVCPPLS